jgi:hypothetical protein
MSLFASYSPESLWKRTHRLLNGLFQEKPDLETCPKSYFVATIHIHNIILKDLSEIFQSETARDQEIPTLAQIHQSLAQVEHVLLGKTSADKYNKDMRGCCLYTDNVAKSLHSYPSTCQLQ